MNFAIDPYLKDIGDAVQTSLFTLLRAEPGSGKTTRVPVMLAEFFKQKICILQPRRIAAIGPAQFVAEQDKTNLGDRIGYQVRFESCFQPNSTKILYMTEGIFLKQMLHPGFFNSIDVVILDEFHERSVAGDFILAWLKKAMAQATIKTKVLIMSATISEKELVDYFDGKLKVLDVPGKQFPLEIFYDKKPLSLRIDSDWFQRVSQKVKDVIIQAPQESLLVFVPGRGEAESLKNKLSSLVAATHNCFTLHGQMSLVDQRSVLQPSRLPKIIFATNVAESSITLNGVSQVIDCGLERKSQWNPSTQMSELQLSRITLANHRQRAGRAAREKPGQAHVLWMKADELSMSPHMLPEILKTDLRYWYLLIKKNQEILNGDLLNWLTPVLPVQWDRVANELEDKRLIEQGKISDVAETCLRLPFEFDGAYWLASASEYNWFNDLLPLIIFILESKGTNESLNSYEIEDDPLVSLEQNWSYWGTHRILLQTAREFGLNAESYKKITFEAFHASYDRCKNDFWKHYIALFPNRLAQRRKSSGHGQKVLMGNGTGAVIHKNSWVKKSPYLICWQIVSLQGEVTVTQAVGLTADWVNHHLAFMTVESSQSKVDHQNPDYEWITRAKKVNAITLSEHVDKVKKNNFLGFKKQFLLDPLHSLQENKTTQQWLIKWLNYNKILNKNNLFPDLLELALVEIEDSSNFKPPYEHLDWIAVFESMLDYNQLRQFKDQMPEFWTLPSGKKVCLDYLLHQAPQCEVLLRDLYGVKIHPMILGQAVRVIILGPHRRPIQITQDLVQFWQSSYPQIKKEMRGRYPKQPWPDDPSSNN